jgi:flagellar hook-basal body complex protein FliE
MIIPPLGGATGGLSLSALEGALPAGEAGAVGGSGAAVPGGEGTGFANELTSAITSLEKTQQAGSSAAQSLATGNVTDPEAAVTTVEDAQLAMQLASQIRTKAVEATQSIFQTQV